MKETTQNTPPPHNVKTPKRLPQDEDTRHFLPFQGISGKWYYPMSPNDVLGHDRWQVYKKLEIEVGTGLTFQKLFDNRHKQRKMLDDYVEKKVTFTELCLNLDAENEALITLSQERLEKAMIMATICIAQEGEDMTKFSMTDAENKVMDWKEYNAVDFFFFAASTSEALATNLKKHMESGLLKVAENLKFPEFTETTDSQKAKTEKEK